MKSLTITGLDLWRDDSKGRIWGIGIDENSPYLNDPFNWNGQNLLGFALMEVRHKLKSIDVMFI